MSEHDEDPQEVSQQNMSAMAEALRRKKAAAHDGEGHSGSAVKAGGATESHKVKRTFRRKSG